MVNQLGGVPIEWHPNKRWYQPTFSPEHGVLLVLLGALLTGASLAQAWTWHTSLACVSAFLGLQAEHPLTVQLKQRRSLKPRYLFWAGVYGSGALGTALWLVSRHPSLIWVCVGGAIAVVLNAIAVLRREQKLARTEVAMFAAICLTTLLTYGTVAKGLSVQAVGLWLLNTLFFAGAVFTIKLRKARTSSLNGCWVYHAVAIALVALLYSLGWLKLLTALTFAIALLKLFIIVWQQDGYRHCRFEHIARFETYFALSYTALVCLSVLPARLPPMS